jgi:large subunit ribosomal protein L24
MLIRVNDTVAIIAGDDAGSRGKVLRVDHAAGKIVVEQINRVYKHVRRSRRNPQGGRLSKEMPIAASNALPVCGSCGAAVRFGARYLDDGSKERYCKKCGAGNGQIAPPKARYARK